MHRSSPAPATPTPDGGRPVTDWSRKEAPVPIHPWLAERFPLIARHAAEMTAGDGDDRFEFGLDLLVSGLAAVSERYR